MGTRVFSGEAVSSTKLDHIHWTQITLEHCFERHFYFWSM
jgi:hypothetical protein